MTKNKVYRAIGLMSGTSLDGIDAALIETDGHGHVQPLDFLTVPYEEADRAVIRKAYGKTDENDQLVREAAQLSAELHAKAVKALGAQNAELVGYHGQTIYHAPADGITLQIGDAALLAAETGVDVVADFRSADVKAGGEGAPLAPLYHRARVLTADLPKPVVILNIGGVGNVTWIGEGAQDVLAFDTGPGNALMDDWVQRHTGEAFDKDGRYAKAGRAQMELVDQWLRHGYFSRKPPKSLDRDEWDIAAFGRSGDAMTHLSLEDGAATLLEFTVQSIVNSQVHMPEKPQAWYVCGGGRLNKALMESLSLQLSHVGDVSELGWNGDATEAECFAYLAVRHMLCEPLSLPGTTGVAAPQTGGVLYRAKQQAA